MEQVTLDETKNVQEILKPNTSLAKQAYVF